MPKDGVQPWEQAPSVAIEATHQIKKLLVILLFRALHDL